VRDRFLAPLGVLTVVFGLAGRLAVTGATTKAQHGLAGALAPLSVAGQASPFREDARTSPATGTWTPPLTPFADFGYFQILQAPGYAGCVVSWKES
jgi:hypothetical protein